MKGFLTFVKDSLGDQVKEVRLSQNLGSYPAAMVPEAGMSSEMEKYMKRVNPEFAYPVGRGLGQVQKWQLRGSGCISAAGGHIIAVPPHRNIRTQQNKYLVAFAGAKAQPRISYF